MSDHRIDLHKVDGHDSSVAELRGFAPIGILECWNTGILGLKGVLFLFLSFTLFQYSSIPAFLIDFAREPINTYNVNRL